MAVLRSQRWPGPPGEDWTPGTSRNDAVRRTWSPGPSRPKLERVEAVQVPNHGQIMRSGRDSLVLCSF